MYSRELYSRNILMIKIPNIKSVLLVLASTGLAAVVGCGENTDSENINTAGMWVRMKADARADGRTRVVVELNVGGELGTNVVSIERRVS